MSKVTQVGDRSFDTHISVVVIGGGACGLTAALKAHDAGSDVVVLERDEGAAGSSAMSSGFIPAPGTRCQLGAGLAKQDSVEIFAADILAKSKGTSDADLVRWSTQSIGPTLDWLESDHGLEWVLLDDFLYPGHARHRMHATPEKTGVGLMTRLTAAADAADIAMLTSAHVTELLTDGDTVRGLVIDRPDGTTEEIGCDAVILACNGYGGNRELVARHIPQMAKAPYYGHVGNQGDAILWGQALNAEMKHLSGCQGHGSLAHPHGILITWALMMEGGVQVNTDGLRFSNEHQGYSEQSISVLAQPSAIAWSVFDERLYRFAQSFPDFQEADKAGAVRSAASLEELATAISTPFDALAATFDKVISFANGKKRDPFGRDFATKSPLEAPYYAVRVTGALFHTQGGLMINEDAHVLRRDGSDLPNLFAAGGAACGVSGPNIDGYLSGNGLLTAIAFGATAGQAAAKLAC
jgi:fumarate reductase flavoprotein subunit